MTDFVNDNTPLPFPKADLAVLPAGADPAKYVRATDWNTVCQACVDLRAYVRAGTVTPGVYLNPSSITIGPDGRIVAISSAPPPFIPLALVEDDPEPGGNYLYATTDGELIAVVAGSSHLLSQAPGAPAGLFNSTFNTAFAANQNNLAVPGGLGNVTLIRYTTSGSFTVTGLAGGVDGRIACFQNNNTSANTFTFTDEDPLSVAGNRFRTANHAPAVGVAGGAVWFRYDGGLSRWAELMAAP